MKVPQPPDASVVKSIQGSLSMDKPPIFPDRTAIVAQQTAAREAAEAAEKARLAQVVVQYTYVAPAPPSGSSDGVPALIIKWSGYYGVDSGWLLRIAACESGYRSNAINRNYYAGGGNPSGVFQFLPDTFNSYSSRAGFRGDIFNADDNVHAAAYAFSHGGAGNWECR